MKAIIKNKIYDTEKADIVAIGDGINIYVTKNGNWFLEVRGINKNTIRSINENQAYLHLCNLFALDAIKKYFPGRIEEA
jgi:hypothetical protein